MKCKGTMNFQCVKNAKHFVLVLKCLGNISKSCEILLTPEKLGIYKLNDDKTMYTCIILNTPDISLTNVLSEYKIGLDLKQLIFGCREITTLNDVLEITFEGSNTCNVTTRTKHNIQTTPINTINLNNTYLDTTPTEQPFCHIEVNVKEFEAFIKQVNEDIKLEDIENDVANNFITV